ncbi:Proline utilization trans-activator [Fusarium albosuccineum]|uniref:Proline utilization trans-activator n=1 Tax=Fusarium albosuccineum TaxID=1237068 RepID=A0A8H4L2A3_9HYPO|nr:Proline utilization trans-activator [Fusarium albosuccineum]
MQSLLQSLESNNAGQPPLDAQPQDPEIDVEVPLSDNTLWDISNIWFPQLDSAPVGGMSEEDQGYYFSLYNNPDWVLMGEDMTDFAEFERHLANLRGGQDS